MSPLVRLLLVPPAGPNPEGSLRAGRVFLMITFGIFFGKTVMTRMNVFIERIWFLLKQWLRIGNLG